MWMSPALPAFHRSNISFGFFIWKQKHIFHSWTKENLLKKERQQVPQWGMSKTPQTKTEVLKNAAFPAILQGKMFYHECSMYHSLTLQPTTCALLCSTVISLNRLHLFSTVYKHHSPIVLSQIVHLYYARLSSTHLWTDHLLPILW